MTTEEKLVQGLKLVVEAFSEMVSKNNNQSNPIIIKDEQDQTFKPAECVFRQHPDTDFGTIWTAYRNYPDSVSDYLDTLSS